MNKKNDWSDSIKKLTVQNFGQLGATMLKSINGEGFCVGYDKSLYVPDCAEKLIPEDSKDIILFRFEDYSFGSDPEGLSFYKSYSDLYEMVDDGWVID